MIGPKEIVQDDLTSVEAKARGFEAIRASDDWQRLKTASDLYIAAFFTPKTGSAASMDVMPLTKHVWQAAGGHAPAEHLRRGATLTSELELRHGLASGHRPREGKVSAFHWFIEPTIRRRASPACRQPMPPPPPPDPATCS